MAVRRCVIVGDVVHSREVADRETLRERLADGLEAANAAVEQAVVAPFTTLKGVDEIGGVLQAPAYAYRAVRAIAEALHPVEIRFAIVWGDIDIGEDAEQVATMDGPAFHEADDLIEDLSETGRAIALSIAGAESWLTTIVRDLVELLFLWKREWTSEQMAVVRRYRTLGTMEAVAEERGVSVQAVSQMLARVEAKRIMHVEDALDQALSAAWGNPA